MFWVVSLGTKRTVFCKMSMWSLSRKLPVIGSNRIYIKTLVLFMLALQLLEYEYF
jgi:hypothetical protein